MAKVADAAVVEEAEVVEVAEDTNSKEIAAIVASQGIWKRHAGSNPRMRT
jgi:hypothetical protein